MNSDPLAGAAETDESVADCVCVNEEAKSESEKEPYGQRVIFKVTDWKEVPKSLREIVNLDRPGDASAKNPLYFSILHKNDNWPTIKGLDSVGLTGVVKFEVGGVSQNNGKPLAWGGYLYSALYSQRIVRTVKPDGKMVNREWNGSWDEFAKTVPEGERTESRAKDDQMTKNQENTVLAMFVNNFPQKKPFMWSLEGGLGVVDTNKGLVMHPLQGVWHKSLGIVKYESISDENDRIYSAYLKGSVGLQKNSFCL